MSPSSGIRRRGLEPPRRDRCGPVRLENRAFERDLDDRLLATYEAMYLHVGKESGRVCEAEPDMLEKVKRIDEAHAGLAIPDTDGRHVGQRH